MLAVMMKIAQLVLPNRVSEPPEVPNAYNRMPSCMEEYHSWRTKI